MRRLTKHNLAIPKTVWRNPWHFLAFGCGVGAIPVAPGTFATLLAIPLYLLLHKLTPYNYLLFLYIFTLAAIWLSDSVARDIAVHDHPGMCIDEVVGYLVTMLYAPEGSLWVVSGFILFRIFDIWKPQPIRFIDEYLLGGLGVVLDDILAGLYSMLCIKILSLVI